MADHQEAFLTAFEQSLHTNTFVKLTLGNVRSPDSELRKIILTPVTLTKGDHLHCVYRRTTNDVAKNIPYEQGPSFVKGLLGSDFLFLSGHLFTTERDHEIVFKNGQSRLRSVKPSHKSVQTKQHNRAKSRPIAGASVAYLSLLGVTSVDGSVKKGMEAKYRQINKFIEIVDPLIRSSPLKNKSEITVFDMGSGKGYLTFALYDYLSNSLK